MGAPVLINGTWYKRAASNGYDLGRDAPFGIVRLPAHSHGSETEEAPHAAPLFCSAGATAIARSHYDASDSGGKSDLAGGNGLSPYVQIVSN